MLKNKPLLVSAIVFGIIGILITISGFIMFLTTDSSGYSIVENLFGIQKDTISMAALCELASVFEGCAFILAVKSAKHEKSN